MRVSTKIVIDLNSGEIVERESYEYYGPIAECISSSLGGEGSKSSTKSKSQSTQESGVAYNEDFLKKGQDFARGTGTTFDAERYLKDHPDVAADPYFSQNPEEHYKYAQSIGDKSFEGNYYTPTQPQFNPQYVRGQYTSLAPGGFDKLESNIYGSQQSKLAQAYNNAVARQREELAQTGAINSPSQYLEGSARSAMDRDYLASLQQAARDASTTRLGAEQTEAARRTAFDTGEAGRETQFSQQTQQELVDEFMKKLALAIQASQFSRGQSTSMSKGSSISGRGSTSGSFMGGGGSSGWTS